MTPPAFKFQPNPTQDGTSFTLDPLPLYDKEIE